MHTPVVVMMRHLAKPMLLLAAAAYLIAATGVLPSAGTAAAWLGLGLDMTGLNAKRAFPCQGHLCGCTSIEDCRSHCCCFTTEELARWEQGETIEPGAICPGDGCGSACGSGCESESTKPDCALCEIDPFAPPAAEGLRVPPAPFAATPLKCKGIELLMLVSAPIATRAAQPCVPALREVGTLGFVEPRGPLRRPGDGVDPPPPRI